MDHVNVIHKIEDDADFKPCINPSFMLSNKIGGFLSLASTKNISQYQGCYFLKQTNKINWTLFKVIEDIKLNKKPIYLINNFFNVERWYENKNNKDNTTKELFFLHENAFLYKLENHNGDVEVTLDCREIYDFDDKGRIYKIYRKKNYLIVEYTKFSDNKLKNEKYKVYLVIKGCEGYKSINKWEQKEYEYDKKRRAKSKCYVYKAINIQVKEKTNLIFSYGDNLELAKEKADELDMDCNKNVYKKEEHLKTLCKMKGEIYDERVKLSYKNCVNSLNGLITNVDEFKGIFAGLPWFFQYWTRDEAISSIGLINEENYLDAKIFLFNQIDDLTRNGRIHNRMPYSKLESADGVGWCFKRINDLLDFTKHKYLDNQYFSKNDIEFIKDKLRKSIVMHLKYFTHDGLAYNRKLETWMDTTPKGKNDFRDGFRIEIQALRLKMYSLMKELCRISYDKKMFLKYKTLEEKTKQQVKKMFWKSPVLADGINEKGEVDQTIRPNIFIAYYVYPELLEEEEWDKCFEYALKKLWLKWGGIATIDKDNKLFCNEYSGENNNSYHRGDSWYWINCLTAICLHRHEKKMNKKINLRLNNKRKSKYEKFIKKIIDASCEEILFKGYIGHHAELSSASEQKGEGCLCQAWSSAIFIELIDEVYFGYLK